MQEKGQAFWLSKTALIARYFVALAIVLCGICMPDSSHSAPLALDSERTPQDFARRVSKLNQQDFLDTARAASQRGDGYLLHSILAKDLARRVGAADSVDEFLAPLRDRKENAELRAFIATSLRHAKRTTTNEQKRQVFDACSEIAIDKKNDERTRVAAIRTAADSLLCLLEMGEAKPAEVQDFGKQLTVLMSDVTESPDIVRACAKKIASLKYRAAIPALIKKLELPGAENKETPTRSVCVALGYLKAQESLPQMARILKTTKNRSVFGSACYAISHLESDQALIAVIRNHDRFGASNSVGAAIRQRLRKNVLSILKNAKSPDLDEAIMATQYLGRPEDVSLMKGLLESLLYEDSVDHGIKRRILNRIYQIGEKSDFIRIVENLPRDESYAAEWELIRIRSTSNPVRPSEAANQLPQGENSNE